MEAGNLNLETLKSSLLFNFRTGNVAFDTIITGLIICLSTYLINFASRIQTIDYHALFVKWFGKAEEPEPLVNSITVSGKKDDDGYRSDTFLALIYRIKNLNCATSEISQLSEIRVDDEYDYDSSDEEEVNEHLDKANKNGANLIVSQPTSFIIEENVNAIVNHHSNKKDDDQKDTQNSQIVIPHEEYQTVKISSAVYSMDELRKMLNQWIKDYRDSTKPDDYLRYFLYSDSYRSSHQYQEYRFDSGKSFDNIFFPQKDSIVKRIDFFTKNKEWYRKRGVPHTLGFMFHGKPGCGKTSTIKAIANYTKRHIVSVPLSKIDSCKELLRVFYNSRINDKYIHLHKRLYVLEDIDADDLKNIVADRKKEKSDSSDDMGWGLFDDEKDDEKEINAANILLKNMIGNKKGKSKQGGMLDMMTSKLTLAGILEVLDGVMEMDGRMLVMTTNYPERLDEALIRPGRIDVKIDFGKCTNKCLVQMYEHFFEDHHLSDLWPTNFDKCSLPTDRWTPAEASQILLSHTNNPHQALETFVQEYPQSSFKVEEQQPQPAIVIQGQDPLTASKLATTPPQEQKQMLGERLIPLIQGMYPELATKITGMLLEIDNSELVNLLEHGESFEGKVDEAFAVLQAHQSKSITCSISTTSSNSLDRNDKEDSKSLDLKSDESSESSASFL